MNSAEFLQKIVSIYSPSGREEEVANFISDEAKKLGFEKTEVDHFNNVVLKIGPTTAKKTIVLLGHIDTVKPFLPVKVEDGELFGRGSVDAKSAFATFVFAALAASKKLKNTKIIVAGAAGEEKHGIGARILAEKFKKPDAVIVGEPSSFEGITLGYKGTFSMEFFKRKTSMHSANASEQNVIEEAIEFTQKIKSFCDKFNSGKSAWEGLQQRVEKFVFDEVNGVEQVKVRVKFRTPLGFDSTDAGLKKLVGENRNGGEISYLQSWGSEAACLASKNSPLVKVFLAAIRAEGGTPVFKVKTGTADMNTFMKAFPDTPTVSYGPGDSNLDHTPEERIHLKEFEKSIAILTKVLVKLDESL
ncbi:M20/M25/M40 family metallo-hydrolase [Patescibacteria group bacterium]|nr:M20/M25/M40 family metallo-hydrolase [Patescibacteria group bacterium]